MPVRRDSKGRFAGSASAKAGAQAGRRNRQNLKAGGSVLRNISNIAASTKTSISGAGVKASPGGKLSVAGRPVGRATAKAVASRGIARARTKELAAFKTLPKAEQRRTSRARRKFLGVN